jgi:hypothetical protein
MNRPRERSGARPQEVPADLITEADVLGRALVPKFLAGDQETAAVIEAVAGAPSDLFYSYGHKLIAEAIGALYEPGMKTMPRALVVEWLVGAGHGPAETYREGGTTGYWHHAIQELYKLDPGYTAFASSMQVTELLDVLERKRRQRTMIGLAGRLEETAWQGTEWHDAADEIAELAARNGAVTKASTLEFVDLGPILRGDAPEVVPIWLRRSDGRGLLYPGRIHDLHAEPSVGKTWLALTAVAEVLNAGGTVIYDDLEDSAYGIVDRLRRLGVPDAILDPAADRFKYLNPPGGHQAAERNELFGVMDRLGADLVVIDGVAEALARDGFDENSNTDVVTWAERLPRPLARRGAAVLMLDHVTKNPEGRARGGRGAGAKLALIDGASYEARLASAYSRHREGMVRIIVAKDRPGLVGAIGETVANVRIQPHNEGLTLTITVEVPQSSTNEAGAFRPSGVMEKLSERLEAADHALPERWLIRSVRARRAVVDEALAGLILDGYVEEVKDQTGRRAYRSIKPYRERTAPRPGLDSSQRAAGEREEPPFEEPPPELFDEEPPPEVF